MKVINTDLLIVGGGGAGTFAAIVAQDAGMRVLLVVKSLLGRGGCSGILGFTGSGVHIKTMVANPNEAFEDKIKYYTHYLGDQDFMKESAAAGPEILPELERMGVYFRRTSSGDLVTCMETGYGLIAPRYGNTGKGVMDVLRAQVFDRKIPVMEEAMATSLLTQDGQVIGATVYDFLHGETYAVRSSAVILATGQVDFLWKRSTATREQAGNGLAMAFRAGAELENIEQKWWHIGDIAYPEAWQRFHLYPNPIPLTMDVAHYYNSAGELFFHSNMYRKSQPSYYIQSKYVMKEIKKGLARPDGGYFVSYRHVDPKLLEEYSLLWKFFHKIGLDPRKDMAECAMCCHQMRGGIRLYPGMATNLPGLFLAGSVAASYISGIVNVCWEGKRAVSFAGDWVRKMKNRPVSNPEQEKIEEARIRSVCENSHPDGVLPAVLKRTIRETMSKFMPYAKSQVKMEGGLEEIRRIKRDLVPRMVVPSASGRFNWDVVDALDVFDMLTCCELDILSGLQRKESRGGFYREDYPVTDNLSWLKKIVLRKGRADGEVEISLVPVELKYVKPPDDKADFLSTEY